MRTLKRSLAFLLALCMALSMTAFAGYEDYPDVREITYVEAVDVLTELGLTECSDGYLYPTGNLTRELAAMLICYMVLGKDVADNLQASTALFWDVPANYWAAGYINYCVAEGYLGGNGDGTFAPKANVTAAQLAKMMLCTVGYGQNGEFRGQGWDAKVTALALQLGVFEGNPDVVFSQVVTREEAYLYFFNTLTKVMEVHYSADADEYYAGVIGNPIKGFDFDETRGAKLYDLKTKAARDVFGRDCYCWYQGAKKITGLYRNATDVIYTTAVRSGTLFADLDLNEPTMATVYRNGIKVSDFEISKGSTTRIGGNGVLVEAYVDEDMNVTLIVIDTYLAKITKISNGEVTMNIWRNGDGTAESIIVSTSMDLNKGDYALVTVAEDEIQTIALPWLVTGMLDEAETTYTVLDGQKFSHSYHLDQTEGSAVYAPAFDTKMCLLLDEYGYMIGLMPTGMTVETTDAAVELDLANGSITVSQTANGFTAFTQNGTEIRTTAGAGIITQSDAATATANTITVENGEVDLTISGINIDSTDGAAIDIKDGAVLHLNLTGENTVIADDYCAGVEVAEGAALTIDGSGSLYAEGAAQGAGIGSGWNRNSGVITINGGTITPAGESTAASLGGGSKGSATIIINGGVVNATQKGSWPAPAIGSGDGGAGSTITITGGTVNATAGYSGVAIGGGVGSGSTITITGGNVTAIGGTNGGVGIGSDGKNAGGSVYISNAVVTASGYHGGIGGRGKGNEYGLDSVVIEDSVTVTLSHKSSDGADVREKIFLTTPAADASAYEGETVTFSVEAEGASGLTYQWLYSKTDTSAWIELEGETTDTLTVPVSAENDGWYYRCRMTNGWGNKLVSSAQLHLLTEEIRGIEYTIERMGMYDVVIHEEYESIPQNQFFLEAEVRNDCSEEVDAILLVQYSKDGQMLDLEYLYSNTKIGETALFGAMIDNRDGNIGCIKAFVVPTVGSMVPLAETMTIE